jgi:hypothetical protein
LPLPLQRAPTTSHASAPINTGFDVSKATADLISAVAQGELLLGEAASLLQMVEAHNRILLISDFEQRLAKLEAENS